MKFTDIFVRRPVFATVLSLIILLVGLKSYFSLNTRLFPKIATAVVHISVTYPGADAELIEGFITTPIENALAGIDGIDYFTSQSSQNFSNITIYFNLGYDINVAVSDINAKISSIRGALPSDVSDISVRKFDPNTHATMYLNFYSDKMSQEEISDYLNRVVQPQLQTLPGVGQARVWGKDYAMRIWLNPEMMAAHKVTATDVKNALATQNLQSPAGQIQSQTQIMNVKTISELNTSDQFNKLVIKEDNGSLIRIQDIGRAELGVREMNTSVFANNKPAVVVPITPAANANPLDVSKAVQALFPLLKQNLPKDLSFGLMTDSSKFIAESIKEVKKTIIEAVICVILVVFLFLGSWRSLLIPAVAIPLSLIGVFGMMYGMGYTLNIITFLALVLAIGMVVDDAIVVMENIHRHIADGKTPIAAAIAGAREIQFAVIAMTFTLAAVYAPIGFLTGLVGALFKEFAFTLAAAVVISGFIALTLSPMMCSKIMKAKSPQGNFADLSEKYFAKVVKLYHHILQRVLQRKKFVVMALPIILCACGILYYFIPSELAPKEDLGIALVSLNGPTSANLAFTEKYSSFLPPMFESIPEKESYLVINGENDPNSAFALLILKPWSERHRTVDQIISELYPKTQTIAGMQAFPFNENSLPVTGGDMPINIVLQTTGTYQQLSTVAEKLVQALRENPKIQSVGSSLNIDQAQLNISIDRNKAGDLGVSIKDIGDTINLGLGQPTISRFSISGNRYDIIPQLDTNFREKPEIINNLYVATAKKEMVSLANLISFKEVVQPKNLSHFQQLRSTTITADITPGYSLGDALSFTQKTCKKILPPGMQINFSGLSRQYFQASGQMAYTFVFALIFIFLVLAAQFESFRDPFIVLFSVPLSIFGALLTMLLTHGTMNIYSQIGLVTLVGLISKHGILMVEFANQLQEQGQSIREAITSAATIRLRPILMTTAAIILGAIPLAFASGAGAVSRQQIGWVIVGGMLVGTMFTLFVVPTMYLYFASSKKKELE